MGKFKLIAGLGNKDKNKVKDLVLLWLKAGADIFDTSASTLAFVQNSIIKEGYNLNDYEFCISIPIEGDIHGKKAKILAEKCKLCMECEKSCIENAIINLKVDEKKCIGCNNCKKVCKYNAIETYDDKIDDFDTLLNTNSKIDIVEIHISINNKEKIINDYEKIISKLKNIHPKVSICLNRKFFSNEDVKEILNILKEKSNGFDFIVQADGNSMNCGREDISSTLEAVAFGLFVKELGYEVTLSGGTNNHTAKLAKMVNLDCSIAYGGYIRKLTKDLSYNEALKTAKQFVLNTKEILNS